MKKTYLLSAIALLSIGLAACSNNKDSSTESTTTQVGSSANRKLAKDLDKQFNTDGQRVVKTKVETDVVDDQSKTDSKGNQKPHEVINVNVIDKETADKLKTDKAAIDNDSATTDQKMYIAGIQEIISKEAKKLSNENDTIKFGHKIDGDNTDVYALSSKTKDVITQVTVD
ncbi:MULTISPECIES: hypothetical protein [Latilactobacillus]|uniref:hypothetical protein n=1 Tax=Latilactobacillus TaxID=2767885 RepID=UPI0020C7B768|nr:MULTISPECIES: hypothetical protein [Latilactobacillus]MCP8855967.1 hypothetical protein [Latilactobacillus sakei]MDT7016324.1 hypothetical protein [Latilactobacillus curvatus]